MLLKKPKLCTPAFFLCALAAAPGAVYCADPAPANTTTPITNRIEAMDKKLEEIKQDQSEILENQKEILEQMQHLKVLIRRS